MVTIGSPFCVIATCGNASGRHAQDAISIGMTHFASSGGIGSSPGSRRSLCPATFTNLLTIFHVVFRTETRSAAASDPHSPCRIGSASSLMYSILSRVTPKEARSNSQDSFVFLVFFPSQSIAVSSRLPGSKRTRYQTEHVWLLSNPPSSD